MGLRCLFKDTQNYQAGTHALLYMALTAKLAEKSGETPGEAATVRVPGSQGSWFEYHQLTLGRIPSPARH